DHLDHVELQGRGGAGRRRGRSGLVGHLRRTVVICRRRLRAAGGQQPAAGQQQGRSGQQHTAAGERGSGRGGERAAGRHRVLSSRREGSQVRIAFVLLSTQRGGRSAGEITLLRSRSEERRVGKES